MLAEESSQPIPKSISETTTENTWPAAQPPLHRKKQPPTPECQVSTYGESSSDLVRVKIRPMLGSKFGQPIPENVTEKTTEKSLEKTGPTAQPPTPEEPTPTTG